MVMVVIVCETCEGSKRCGKWEYNFRHSFFFTDSFVVPDKNIHGELEQPIRSRRYDDFVVAGVEKHQLAVLLVRAVPVQTLDLPITSLLHADTETVLAGELVVAAGRHCHVPTVVRPTGVVVDLPGLSPK